MPEVIFNGPDGRLEGRYHHNADPNGPLAVILHPHPQHGGSMNNRVVYELFQIFKKRNFSVLRFNFRGVGRSQGAYSRGEGELSDAAAALDWMQTLKPDAKDVWVAGYSFGAWIGMQLLMRRPEIGGFFSIGAPANLYDFTFLAPCPSSGLFLHAGQDEIVQEDAVKKLVEKLRAQRGIAIDYERIPGATHTFGNHLEQMNKSVEKYLDKRLAEQEAAA
ncbi:MAG: alpha/beta hydrolase [Alphaproteobacteria bacterium]|jgi:alpha/beta superfamily hydrolase